jgi:uncharacterized phage-associated protein
MSDVFKRTERKFGKVQPLNLAGYILAKLGRTDHLKLQKLLYYVQSWHLGIFNEPLFDEDFKAWVHGPVLSSVWNELKDHSKLTRPMELTVKSKPAAIRALEDALKKEQVELISDVLEEYGDKTGYHLECLTHSESPWKDAREGLMPDEKGSARITKDSMRKFYQARLNSR